MKVKPLVWNGERADTAIAAFTVYYSGKLWEWGSFNRVTHELQRDTARSELDAKARCEAVWQRMANDLILELLG